MNRLSVIPILLVIAGCATAKTPEPIVVTKPYAVPVAVACVPDTYDRKQPDYVDSNAALKAAADAAERYWLLWAGRSQRMARENENEVVIAGCLSGSSK